MNSAQYTIRDLISQEVLDEIQRSFVEKHGVGLCIYSEHRQPLTDRVVNLPALEQLTPEQQDWFQVFYRIENLDTGFSHADTKPINRSFATGMVSRSIFPIVYQDQLMAFAVLLHIPNPLSPTTHNTLLANLKRVNEDVERLDLLLDKTSSFQSDMAVWAKEVRNIVHLFIEAGSARAHINQESDPKEEPTRRGEPEPQIPEPRNWNALLFCSPTGAVIDALPDAAELLGFDTPSELCDLNLLNDLVRSENDRHKVRSLVLSESNEKLELSLSRKQNEPITLSLQLFPQRDGRSIIGFECRLSPIEHPSAHSRSEMDKDKSAIGIINDHMQKKQDDESVSDSLVEWDKASKEESHGRRKPPLDVGSTPQSSNPFMFSFKGISQLLDAVPFPLFVVDAEDKVRVWNHSMETLLAIDAPSVLEENFLSRLVSNSHPTWERWKRQVFAGEPHQAFTPKIRLPLIKNDKTVLLAPVKLYKVRMYDRDFISVMVMMNEPFAGDQPTAAAAGHGASNKPDDARLSVLQRHYKKIRTQFAQAAETLSDSVSELYIESLQNEASKQKYTAVRRISDICAYINRQLKYFTQESVPSLQQVDMNYVVNEISMRLQRFLPSSIELRTNFDKTTNPVVADQDMLVHAVGTIAKNAIDAMPQGGTLTIKTESKYDTVLISVSDSGTGITPEVLNHVFEPFYTTKEHAMGKGLGLSAAYGIVRAHGGNISIKSDPHGSMFSVILPVNTPSLKNEPSSKGKVLVIDDAADIAEATSLTLRREGYETVIATSCKQGVHFFQQHREALNAVIIDNRLGDYSGLDCARHILKISPHVPIVFYSGADDDVELAAFIRKRGAGWLQKPFTSKELAAEVEKVIRSKKNL